MNQDLRHASLQGSVSAEEWQLRVDLAACYRLIALFGWDDMVFSHVSARVPGESHQFLINPYGLFFEEITASSLVKIDHDGQPVMDTPYDVNPAGFVIHSAVHEGRPDVNCVLHTHTVAGVGVAAQADGLLPISQQAALVLANVAYHGYEGLAVNDDEKARLVADLGEKNILILRNHGLLTCGHTVAEAFRTMYRLENACRMQIAAQAGGSTLTTVPESVVAGMRAQSVTVTRGKGADLVWPGLLRRLDRQNPGYAV